MDQIVNWTFREDAKPQGSSAGFYYDLTDGGYIVPDDVLANLQQVAELNKAIEIVRSFEQALFENDLLND